MTKASCSPSPPISSPEGTALDRRSFLGRIGVNAAALAAAPVAAGCTVPIRSFHAGPAERVRIELAGHPELSRSGGRIRVISPLAGPIYLTRSGDDYVALSGVCTHQGCTVQPAGQGFRCPCHGSRFDSLGTRMGGPAREPLPRILVERADGALVIHVNRPAASDPAAPSGGDA